MCGITGFACDNSAAKALEGLKTLEYRGYDSAGIAGVENGKVWIEKTVGDVDALSKRLAGKDISKCDTAIAHTRWATHGGVSEANAHPHQDCTGKIAVAHNGIIENFQQLRAELESRGHKFSSQTDTEVISHLFEEECKKDPFEIAGFAVMRRLKGSFAMLAVCADAPGVIVAAKNESPLVVACGEDYACAASDPVPIAFAQKGMFLEDGDYAVLKRGKIRISEIATGRPVERREIAFGAGAKASDKKQYAHFMLKEIHEAPIAIKTASMQDENTLEAAAKAIRDNRVVFVACGTSRHAALVGRYLLNRNAGKFCEVVVASEFPYIAKNLVGKDLLVIAVSQSGETADVIEGVKIAKANGAKVLTITNVVGSSLDRVADYTLHLQCGPEIGVAATKTFNAQLAIMYMLAAAVAGKTDAQKKALLEVSKKCNDALDGWDKKTRELARKMHNQPAAYFIARGPNFPTALEGALKFKEITYIHAEGMAAGELKHGTLALISKGTPVIAVCPSDYTHDATISNVMETKARGAFVIGLSDEPNQAFDETIEVPKVEPEYYPLVFAGALQLLAYHTAVLKGNNPDRPRNLAKSVTVK